MRLSELNTGEKGVIVKVLGHGGFRKRIVEMGFIKGKTVEVILNAPLKDPIKYRLLDYEISLRRQEAEMIEVVSEQEARTTQSPYHGSITEEITVPEAEMVALAKGKRIIVASLWMPKKVFLIFRDTISVLWIYPVLILCQPILLKKYMCANILLMRLPM